MYQKRESRTSPVLAFCLSRMTVPWPCCGFISRFLSAHPAWSLSTVFPLRATVGDGEELPSSRCNYRVPKPDAIVNTILHSLQGKTQLFSTLPHVAIHPLKVKITGSTPVRATKFSSC